MALKGFLIGVSDGIAEVLTDNGKVIKVKADRAKGLPPLRPSLTRPETRQAGNPQTLAFDYLTHVKGWKPHQAAAIVGRLSQESNLDPTAVGDNGTAFGIAQWRGIRNVRRLKFHRERGSSPKDLLAELDFVDYELRNFETKAFETISASRTLDEAAKGMMHYERPAGYTSENPEFGHGYSNTLQFANDVIESAGPSMEEDFQETLAPEAPPVEAAGPQTLGDVVDLGSILSQTQDSPSTEIFLQEKAARRKDTIQHMITQGIEAYKGPTG